MRQLARTHAFWLALVRIYTGYFFFSKGFAKLMAYPPFNGPQGFLPKYLSQAANATVGTFYHGFLTQVVIPNTSTFGFLVEFGEMVAGALLILGVFTRLGAILAMFLVLNYWLASGQYTGFTAYASLDWAAFFLAFVSLTMPTGRFLGLDAFSKRQPRAQQVVTPVPVPAQPAPAYTPPRATPYTPPPAYSPPPAPAPPPYTPPSDSPPQAT